MFGLEIIVIFVIVWWLVLFIALPFGIKQEDKVKEGNDPGAPKNPMLKKKIVYTTIVSAIISIVISIIKNEVF